MGHLPLGLLPKIRRWAEVIDLLDAGTNGPVALADAVIRADEHPLHQLANDQGLGYNFWLLTRIAWAARGQNFAESLSALSINVSQDASSLQVIAQVADRVRTELSNAPSSGDFAEIGSLALPPKWGEKVAS